MARKKLIKIPVPAPKKAKAPKMLKPKLNLSKGMQRLKASTSSTPLYKVPSLKRKG